MILVILDISYSIDGVSGSGSTLAGTEFVGGTYSIVWWVEDLSGNVDSCAFKINIIDATFPSISTITDKSFFGAIKRFAVIQVQVRMALIRLLMIIALR